MGNLWYLVGYDYRPIYYILFRDLYFGSGAVGRITKLVLLEIFTIQVKNSKTHLSIYFFYLLPLKPTHYDSVYF
ncbi:hypothetical protein CJ263_01875 [Maribacter cobaltidurans]|uniref:Uncharacterized protein n=1 Tax=Maribacter cobaltidurans TaxID=1178778 RepID=A0A223V176_9FLAO|nr:hypothetical protein CJ263_01875 [Maribacter cobaltidurans]